MGKNSGNRERCLRAQFMILNALMLRDSPIGFNDLHGKASVSSKTLARHLKILGPGVVEVVDRKYRLTERGRALKESIKQELDELRGGRKPREVVEVYSLGPKYFCEARIEVACHAKLQPNERSTLDRRLTEMILALRKGLPARSKNCHVSINWRKGARAVT